MHVDANTVRLTVARGIGSAIIATTLWNVYLRDDDDDDVEEQQQQLVCCGFSFGKGGEMIEIRNNVHKSNEIATKALPEN